MSAPTPVRLEAVGGASSGTLTSAAFTPNVNDVYTLIGVGEGGAANNAISTPTTTLSNGGITALQNIGAGSPAAHCDIAAHTFTVSASASGTVSEGASGTETHILGVFVHRNANAAVAGRSVSAASSAKTLAYGASQADSAICWGLGDWSAVAASAETPASTSHNTSTPGPTAFPINNNSSQYTWGLAVIDDQTSVASINYGTTGSSTGPFSIVVVEVQGQASTYTRETILLEDGSGPILGEGSYPLNLE